MRVYVQQKHWEARVRMKPNEVVVGCQVNAARCELKKVTNNNKKHMIFWTDYIVMRVWNIKKNDGKAWYAWNKY